MKAKLITLISKYIVYIAVIVITILVKERFPFSCYPMYNHFPNYSYSFYMVDENGNNLGSKLAIPHGSLSHLFFNECNKIQMSYGFGKEDADLLEKVSIRTIQSALNLEDLKIEGIQSVTFIRIYNYIDREGQMVSDTSKLATINTYESAVK